MSRTQMVATPLAEMGRSRAPVRSRNSTELETPMAWKFWCLSGKTTLRKVSPGRLRLHRPQIFKPEKLKNDVNPVDDDEMGGDRGGQDEEPIARRMQNLRRFLACPDGQIGMQDLGDQGGDGDGGDQGVNEQRC